MRRRALVAAGAALLAGRIFTDSLISNRVTRFTTASMTPAP